MDDEMRRLAAQSMQTKEDEERAVCAADLARWLRQKVQQPDKNKCLEQLMSRVAALVCDEGLRGRLIRSMRSDEDLIVGFTRPVAPIKALRINDKSRGDGLDDPALHLFQQAVDTLEVLLLRLLLHLHPPLQACIS